MVQLMRKLILHFHSDTARQKVLLKVILAKTFVLKNIRNIFKGNFKAVSINSKLFEFI